MVKEMKLPELGENIEAAQVLSVLVSPGDRVERDQAVIELETDKATAEVPSEVSGVVKEVRIKEGDEIKVGQTILTVEENGAAPSAPASKAAPAAKATEPETAAEPGGEPAPSPATREGTRPGPAASEGASEETAGEATAEPAAGEAREEAPRPEPAPARAEPAAEGAGRTGVLGASSRGEIGRVAPAAPSVRRLARELGIDVDDVPGTGPGGRISPDDVKAYVRYVVSTARENGGRPSGGTATGAFTTPELPDFSAWGEVEREPASKLRRLTAEAMSTAWRTIPHVTQFDRADVTELEAWRARQAKSGEDPKVTVTAVAVKVAAAALRRFPRFNASYDDRAHEIVLKKYVNVGVAVDTDRGLLVPVIRDADRKGVLAIAAELAELAGKARTRKISADELQGANFNISNLGGLGTTYFSPIVNWPQVAVVGIGRANREAVYRDPGAATPEPRLILPLAVSYDHRAVDGADAARFLRWFAEALEQPILLALEG